MEKSRRDVVSKPAVPPEHAAVYLASTTMLTTTSAKPNILCIKDYRHPRRELAS